MAFRLRNMEAATDLCYRPGVYFIFYKLLDPLLLSFVRKVRVRVITHNPNPEPARTIGI